MSVRLRSDASIPLLAADLFVLWFCWPNVMGEYEDPTWMRAIFFGVSLLAVAFACRTSLLLARQWRRRGQG